jgi:hypothetical protein
MQTDVKVFTPEVLAEIFPGLTIKGKPTENSCVYAINVPILQGDDLLKLVTVYLEYPIDLFLSRYGKGITIKVTFHPEGSERARVLKIMPLETA